MLPSEIVTTGWPAVRDKAAEFGDSFDEWQDGAGRAILGKRADGLYAATIGGVVLSIPRQVAKTFLVSRIVFVLCILFPGLQVVWTAHRTRTATRTFRSLRGYASRKKVKPYILHIRTANGEQEIAFCNGSVIMFGAREMGFGRGFEEIDVEVFDEAQILGEKALDDMIAATNQSRHPHGALLFYMGTPPRPTDSGEAFKIKRRKALAGADDIVYIEFSADSDADLDDRKQWARANPSYPQRTPLESMLRLRENLISDEGWKHEGLGIWDELDEDVKSKIDPQAWGKLADPDALLEGRPSISVEVSPDRRWVSIGVAGSSGGKVLVFEKSVRGISEGVAHVVKTARKHDLARVALDPSGQAGSLISALEDEGLQVESYTARGMAQACGLLLNLIEESGLTHLGQDEMTVAARMATTKESPEGTERWDRREGGADISPLIAVTIAAREHLRSADYDIADSVLTRADIEELTTMHGSPDG